MLRDRLCSFRGILSVPSLRHRTRDPLRRWRRQGRTGLQGIGDHRTQGGMAVLASDERFDPAEFRPLCSVRRWGSRWAQQSFRGGGALSIRERARYLLPHPWHHRAMVHWAVCIERMHPDVERTRDPTLRASSCGNTRDCLVTVRLRILLAFRGIVIRFYGLRALP